MRHGHDNMMDLEEALMRRRMCGRGDAGPATGLAPAGRAIVASFLILGVLAIVSAQACAGGDARQAGVGPGTPSVSNEARRSSNCEGVCPNPCGPACLGFALKHFGIEPPGPAPLSDPAPNGGAAGIEQIKAACERAGLCAVQVRLDVRGLARLLDANPSARVILALKEGHFCYVQAARDGQFSLVTLSGETRWCKAEKIAALWPGQAVAISDRPLPGDPAKTATPGAGATTAPVPLRIVFFHSPSCHECRRVKSFLPQITGRWGARIAVELHNVEDINTFDELLRYEQHYKATVAAPPAIFVGDKALVGEDVIVEQLDGAVAEALAGGTATFSPAPKAGPAAGEQLAVPSEILSRFEAFGPAAIAMAGLIDGINPCAFTTIVFFLSMLAYLKKTRGQMLAVDVGFTAGMFAAYFLLGLGLLGAVKTFSVSHGVSSGMACGVAILAFALALWSLIDAIRYIRTGDTRQVTLGLPKKLKDRIHRVIRTGLTTRGLVIGSVSIGFVVSILESLCTGQVYLPTIVFMTRAPGMRTAAVAYLLLYNVMFILPLVGILAMTYFGVRSEALGNMLRKRLALAKFGMAGLFLGLGVQRQRL